MKIALKLTSTGAFPQVKGFTMEFVDVYSSTGTTFYGSCDDDADTSVEGVVKVLSDAEFATIKQSEVDGIRRRRDYLLKTNVDSINPIRWESMSDAQKDAIRTYRQALLEVPQQANIPLSVTWPTLSI